MKGERPEDKRERILEERARRLAQKIGDDKNRSSLLTAAIITAGGSRFAVPAEFVREIIRIPQIMKLPGLPPWLPGFIHLRGELICLADVSHWFNTEASNCAGFVVVVQGAPGPLGLLADEIAGFKEILSEDLAENLMDKDENKSKPLKFVTKDLTLAIDVNRLLNDPDVVVDQSTERKP